MLLRDFFGHKIHASGGEWGERLCLIAHIFAKHEGAPYSGEMRKRLLADLEKISPRVYAERRGDNFRDEITAYQSHLGVYRFRQLPGNSRSWSIEMTKTAKRFLLCEAPDVAAFLRLQLPLFQYPNGIGVDHRTGRIQHNAAKNTWEFVNHGVNFAPVRLLAVALLADADLRGDDLVNARVSGDELYTLANLGEIYRNTLPPIEIVRKTLRAIRGKQITINKGGEKRFRFLNYTQLFHASSGKVGLRAASGKTDADNIESALKTMAGIDARFAGFDNCKSKEEMRELICSDEWGDYYDAVERYPEETVRTLLAGIDGQPSPESKTEIRKDAALRKFDKQVRPYTPAKQRKGDAVIADPEITRIKKERRNVAHALMVSRLLEWLEDLGVKEVGDSVHIDLWAKLADGRVFIFEVKSGGEGIMEQVRKGVSQLHEYRYRYSEKFPEARICLVLPNKPPVKWVPHYLCRDRNINLCLLPVDESPKFDRLCREVINGE